MPAGCSGWLYSGRARCNFGKVVISMSTYKKFKNSDRLEKDGIVLDLGDSGKFRIARAGGENKSYQARLEAAMRPHRRALQNNSMSNDAAEDILKGVIIDTVLLGWDGVTDFEGKPMSFSKQNAATLFDDLPDLFAAIRDAASDGNLFREDVGLDTGN